MWVRRRLRYHQRAVTDPLRIVQLNLAYRRVAVHAIGAARRLSHAHRVGRRRAASRSGRRDRTTVLDGRGRHARTEPGSLRPRRRREPPGCMVTLRTFDRCRDRSPPGCRAHQRTDVSRRRSIAAPSPASKGGDCPAGSLGHRAAILAVADRLGEHRRWQQVVRRAQTPACSPLGNLRSDGSRRASRPMRRSWNSRRQGAASRRCGAMKPSTRYRDAGIARHSLGRADSTQQGSADRPRRRWRWRCRGSPDARCLDASTARRRSKPPSPGGSPPRRRSAIA